MVKLKSISLKSKESQIMKMRPRAKISFICLRIKSAVILACSRLSDSNDDV